MLETPCCIGVLGFCLSDGCGLPMAVGVLLRIPLLVLRYILACALVCPCLCFGLFLLVLRISYLISCPELAEVLAKIVNLKHILTMAGDYFFLPSCISFDMVLPF